MPVHVNNVNKEVSVGLKIHEVQGATVLHHDLAVPFRNTQNL